MIFNKDAASELSVLLFS